MELVAGRTLVEGRYALVREIGRGATGHVWEARHVADGRVVAIKCMPAEAGGRAAAEREAEVAVRVKHPAVVRILLTHEEDGLAFVVMERCAGSLASRVTLDGPLAPGAALAAMLPVLEALAAAHAVGVIHRDVKAANVLARADGSIGLGDWGIARALFGGGGATTTSLAVLGTLPYLAPELRKDARAATPASDVYAAGITLAWLCRGEPPSDPFMPEGQAELRAALPAPLVEVVLRACAWSVSGRYASAQDMATGVREALAALEERADQGAGGRAPPVPRRPHAPLPRSGGVVGGGVPEALRGARGEEAPAAGGAGAGGFVGGGVAEGTRPRLAPPGASSGARGEDASAAGDAGVGRSVGGGVAEGGMPPSAPGIAAPAPTRSGALLVGFGGTAALLAAGLSAWTAWRGTSPVDRPLTTGASDVSAEVPACADAAREFTPQRTLGPVETVDASVGDLDGDGHLDVIYSNQGDESVTLAWGRAGGLPDTRETLAVGRVSGATAVTDVDADGVPDLVVPHRDEARFTVWRGRGARRFENAGSVSQAPSPGQVQVAGVGSAARLLFDADGFLFERQPSGGTRWPPHVILSAPARSGQFAAFSSGDGTSWVVARGDAGWELRGIGTTPDRTRRANLPAGVDTASHVVSWWNATGPVALGMLVGSDLLRVDVDDSGASRACRSGKWTDPGAALEVIADLDADGTPDLVATETCSGCTSNQIVARGVR